jgi:DNA primase large subunit
MDIQTMARYPYLKETVSFVREHGPSLEELNTSMIYQNVRGLGRERVHNAIQESKIPDRAFFSEPEALEETLSYIVARILVSCINDFYLIRRYALSEAKLMSERLNNEPTAFKLEVASELGISAESDDGVTGSERIKIHVADYLRHSTSFRSDDWKLVNQDLKAGFVSLEPRKLVRLLEHALQIRFEGELPLPVSDDIKKKYAADSGALKSMLGNIKKKYEVKDFGQLKLERLPGCMKQILAMIQAGENQPHSARFAITAFLHTIGLNEEEILKLFGKSPDFDASIARYQIEHITGSKSGTEYLPPGCGKLKSYGLCYNPDRLCGMEWMNHPLKYYRIKGKDAEKKPSKKDSGKRAKTKKR